jgi:hypothetical protein
MTDKCCGAAVECCGCSRLVCNDNDSKEETDDEGHVPSRWCDECNKVYCLLCLTRHHAEDTAPTRKRKRERKEISTKAKKSKKAKKSGDELSRLKEENLKLKTQIEKLKRKAEKNKVFWVVVNNEGDEAFTTPYSGEDTAWHYFVESCQEANEGDVVRLLRPPLHAWSKTSRFAETNNARYSAGYDRCPVCECFDCLKDKQQDSD